MANKFPLGKYVTIVREKLGMSIEELAGILKTNPANLYKWEGSKAAPKYDNRDKLDAWLESVHWKQILRDANIPIEVRDTSFTLSDIDVPYTTQPEQIKPQHDYKEKYIASLEARVRDMEVLQRIIDRILTTIHDDQLETLNIQKLLTQLELLKNAGADEKKLNALLTQINQHLKDVTSKPKVS